MTQKRIRTFSHKKCEGCGKTIEIDMDALADFDGHPYRFWHLECAQGPKDKEIGAFEEQVLAVLSDHSQDLLAMKAMLRSIYEAQFPTQPKPVYVADLKKEGSQ